jgi:hypothetical protein
LLIELALPASSQAQEKCKWETVEVSADADRKAMLDELQHEMKPEFTFTIGDTGVLTHPELTGAKLPDAASLRRQMENLPDEEHYPYTHSDSLCRIEDGPRYRVKIWDYVETDGGDPTIEVLKRAVFDHGPIVAGIVATELFWKYKTGVFNELPNDTDCVNHGIVIIGWDDSKHAWHIKNSWGKCGRRCWGEDGFGWVAYRANHIGYAAAWAEAKTM